MIIDYYNRKAIFFKVFFSKSFGLIFFSIILVGIIGVAIYFYRPGKYTEAIIGNSVLLLFIWGLEYFRYYKFIFEYLLFNKGKTIRIDVTEQVIQLVGKNGHTISNQQKIESVTLHLHERSRLLFETPQNFGDKMENYLHKHTNNNQKYDNIWFLKMTTSESQTYIVTSLMTKLDEIPFKDFDVVYDSNPVLKKNN